MRKCWEASPADRPTFTELVKDFEELLMQDCPYLDFSSFDSSKDYYNVPSYDSAQDGSSATAFRPESMEEVVWHG